MKLKVKHFQVYDLVTVCFDYGSEILRRRYREPVQYIGSIYVFNVKNVWTKKISPKSMTLYL
jgi:hypothetical protein